MRLHLLLAEDPLLQVTVDQVEGEDGPAEEDKTLPGNISGFDVSSGPCLCCCPHVVVLGSSTVLALIHAGASFLLVFVVFVSVAAIVCRGHSNRGTTLHS